MPYKHRFGSALQKPTWECPTKTNLGVPYKHRLGSARQTPTGECPTNTDLGVPYKHQLGSALQRFGCFKNVSLCLVHTWRIFDARTINNRLLASSCLFKPALQSLERLTTTELSSCLNNPGEVSRTVTVLMPKQSLEKFPEQLLSSPLINSVIQAFHAASMESITAAKPVAYMSWV